jgi:hypothetical protein
MRVVLGRLRRGEPAAFVAALVLFATGAVAGWDLSRDRALFVEAAVWIAVASSGALLLQLQWCAYSDELRFALLPLPIAAADHLSDAVSTALRRSWPAAMGALGVGAGALATGRTGEAAVLAARTAVAWIAALGIGSAATGVAGRLARRAGSGTLAALQSWLGGGWSAPEHAPFFYAPALALAATAIVVLATGPRPWIAPIFLPLVFVGRAAAAGSLFEVVARVHEHALALRRPGEAGDEPATLAWRALLPARARPMHGIFLRQIARRTRGQGVLAALVLASIGVYLLRRGADASPWAASAAVVLVAWLARTARVVGDASSWPRWMREVLPVRRSDSALAAWLASVPGPLVVAMLAALALFAAGQRTSAVVVAVAGALLPLSGSAAPRTPWIQAGLAGVLAVLPLAGVP